MRSLLEQAEAEDEKTVVAIAGKGEGAEQSCDPDTVMYSRLHLSKSIGHAR